MTERPPMTDQAVALLLGVLTGITLGFRPWVQRFYALFQYDANDRECGSAYCVAGHLVIAAGHRIHPSFIRDRADLYEYTGLVQPEAYEVATAGTVGGVPDVLSIAVQARNLLGVTEDETTELFDASQTLAGLWEVAERISDGRVTPTLDLLPLIDDRRHNAAAQVPA